MHSFILDISLSRIAGLESRLMSHFPKRLYVFTSPGTVWGLSLFHVLSRTWLTVFQLEPFGGGGGDFSLWWLLSLSSILYFYWPWKLLWSIYSSLLSIFFYCFFLIDLRSYPFVSDVNIANIVSHAMDCLFMFKSRSLIWGHKGIVLCYLLEALFIIYI